MSAPIARPAPPPPARSSAGSDLDNLSDAALGVFADFVIADAELRGDAAPELYLCAWCEHPIEGVPVTDPEHVAIFGYERAAKFTNDECLVAYAEANALH